MKARIWKKKRKKKRAAALSRRCRLRLPMLLRRQHRYLISTIILSSEGEVTDFFFHISVQDRTAVCISAPLVYPTLSHCAGELYLQFKIKLFGITVLCFSLQAELPAWDFYTKFLTRHEQGWEVQ